MASVYIMYDDRILLLYRQGGRVVNEVWTGSAGGHFEPSELNDARACAVREMGEEIGLAEDDLDGLEMRYVTMRRVKGEVRQNFYFFARLRERRELRSNEGVLRWFGLDELAGLPMPYSARFMLEHYLTVGRWDHDVYVGVADGERVVFNRLPEY